MSKFKPGDLVRANTAPEYLAPPDVFGIVLGPFKCVWPNIFSVKTADGAKPYYYSASDLTLLARFEDKK